MRRPGPLTIFSAALIALAGCEVPPVYAGADARQNARGSRIEGQVLYSGTARGNIAVFLYDATRPPPPIGTGRPIAFSLVAAERLFGAAMKDGSSGPFVAPFAFSLVPEGRYLIAGFLDRNECLTQPSPCQGADFVPWHTVTAEPNAGDIRGGLVDPVTLKLKTLELVADPIGELAPLLGVTVSFSSAATTSPDRPAWRVKAGSTQFFPAAGNHLLELEAYPLNSGLIRQTQPAFLVRYVDDDGNGTPDDANADGQPEFYPKVYVRKLADVPGGLTDENDLDRNGLVDPEGAEYPRTDGTTDGRPDVVLLAAGLDPTDALPTLNPGGTPSVTAVSPQTVLRVVIKPAAFDVRNPSAPAQLGSVPKGKYAITLVQWTGQTWRMPNELQPAVAPTFELPIVESQAFTLTVP